MLSMKTTRATFHQTPQNRFYPNYTNRNSNRLVLTGNEMALEQPMEWVENKNSHRSGSIGFKPSAYSLIVIRCKTIYYLIVAKVKNKLNTKQQK